ncbi:MAG: zinc-binding dehydrogenase [Burkholderiales bacterium]|nr:zinc-binding dehydrogenase [Burkholderiales bacterium]
MRAFYVLDRPDGTTLEAREVATPEPGPGQLLIRVRASALNRGELTSLYAGAAGTARPGGAEAAGEVVAPGSEARRFAPGTRVMGRLKGGFAEYALLDAGEAMIVPERLGWEEAATVPIVFLVAYDMLVTYGRLARGEWVLIAAVSSGVGVASLQLAKAMCAKVIGTSGSGAKLAKLRSLDLDAGIATRGDFVDEVMRITGKHGADLAINNVGGTVFPALVRAAAYRGRIATVGYVDGTLHADLDLGALHAKRLELFGVSNRLRTAEERALTVAGFTRDSLPFLADGTIRPLIDRTFDFDALPQAKAYFDTNTHVGKIAIRL